MPTSGRHRSLPPENTPGGRVPPCPANGPYFFGGGDPVVLIGGSDIPAYQQMSLVTAEVLKRVGFKVDMQMTDWGTALIWQAPGEK